MIPGFHAHGVLCNFCHMAIDALTARAGRCVMSMLGYIGVLRTQTLTGSMTRKAKCIRLGGLYPHGSVPRTMRIVAIAALQSGMVHFALQKSIPLHSILVCSAVVPEFGRLLALRWLEARPIVGQLFAGLITHCPAVFGTFGLAGLMAGEAHFRRTLNGQPRWIDDIGDCRLFHVCLTGPMAALTGDVKLRPRLFVVVHTRAVAPRTQFEI